MNLSCQVKSHLHVLLLSCFILLPVFASAQTEDSLKIRVSVHPPYTFFDEENQKWSGISIDILTAVSERANLNFSYFEMPRKRAFTMLKAGKIDVMLNLTPTEERREFLDFVGLSSYEQMVLIVKEENKDAPIRSLDYFIEHNLFIGVRHRYHYPQLSDRLKTDEKLQRQVVLLDDSMHRSVAQQVRKGSYFGYFEDKNTLKYLIKNNKTYNGLAINSFSLNEPQEVHIAVRKDLDIVVRDALREAHKALTNEGVIGEIIEKWDKL